MKFKPWMLWGIFIVPAGLMLLLAAYVAGGTTMICQRVESTQIDCTLSNRRWLGLVDAGSQTVQGLTGAHIESYECDTTDSKGNRRRQTCSNLALDTRTGPAHFDLLTESLQDINTFVNASTSPVLTVQNNRWVFSIAVTVFALLWLGSGLFVRRLVTTGGEYGQPERLSR